MICNCVKNLHLHVYIYPTLKQSEFQRKCQQLRKTDTSANNCTKEDLLSIWGDPLGHAVLTVFCENSEELYSCYKQGASYMRCREVKEGSG